MDYLIRILLVHLHSNISFLTLNALEFQPALTSDDVNAAEIQ